MTLRIQKSVEPESTVFKLVGRIQAQHVPDLLALLKSETSYRGIVLDLEQVKLVDRDAVLFLALSEALGVRLRNCSAFIRQWIDQERFARRNGTDDSTESAG
jgi:anti-anti-sigma regulatory factor